MMVAKVIKYNGECRTLKEWSEITGVGYSTLTKRVRRAWPTDILFSKRPFRNYLGPTIDVSEIESLLLMGLAAKRRKVYKQLRKDFKELEQHLKVA